MVRVALVGAGFMGKMHAACYAKLAGQMDVTVAWVVDQDEATARALAEKCGGQAATRLEEALNDPRLNAVDICLPTYLHPEYVRQVAAAGKDILCEKPIALSVAAAEEMVRCAREYSVKFMCAQVIRFWPEYEKLAEIYRTGELGALLSASFQRMGMAPVWSWQNWYLDKKKSGLSLVDLHIHDTDFIYSLLGNPREVTSRVSGAEYGRIHSLFSYPEVLVAAEAGWDMPEAMPFMMAYQAIFEEGMVEFNTRLNPAFSIFRGDRAEHPEFPKITAADTGGNISELGGYYREIEYFVDCLANDREPELASGESAGKALALLFRELESAGYR